MLDVEMWLKGIGLKQPIEAWPPDLFALAGTLLRRSGAYLKMFEQRGPAPFLDGIVGAAAQWRNQIDAITASPVTETVLQSVRIREVITGWRSLIQAKSTLLSQIHQSAQLVEQLIRMKLIADEALSIRSRCARLLSPPMSGPSAALPALTTAAYSYPASCFQGTTLACVGA